MPGELVGVAGGGEAREVTGTEHVVRTLSFARSGWEPLGSVTEMGWDLTQVLTGSLLL